MHAGDCTAVKFQHMSLLRKYSFSSSWGSNKARGRYEQCLLEREVDGRLERGWTWNFPGLDPSVFAYPEIIFGWKPWSGGPTSDARFPLKVADVGKLVMHYEVETEASGNYNLAPEVWLTRSKGRGEANPKRFWVYMRNGQPCYECRAPIERFLQGDMARSTYFCPHCQA